MFAAVVEIDWRRSRVMYYVFIGWQRSRLESLADGRESIGKLACGNSRAVFFYVHSDASHSDLSTVIRQTRKDQTCGGRQVTVVITTLQCSRCSDVEALMFVSAFYSRSIQIIRRFQA